MSDLSDYDAAFAPTDPADPDRFASAIARLQGARVDQTRVEPSELPSRRSRRTITPGEPIGTSPAAALEFARLYSATAGHPLDDDPAIHDDSDQPRKPRFSLARTTALVAVCAVLTVGGGVVAGTLWPSAASIPTQVVAAAEPAAAPIDETPAVVTNLPDPPDTPEVLVHVVGQVAQPGVVTLAGGSRVADAIAAAGGATGAADLAAINLARIVVDGEQLRVPAPGEEVAPPPLGPLVEPVETTGPSGNSTTRATGLINLNTADAAALQTLPGIGPALSQRIIDWREANGPFASVEEITNVSGIGPSVLSNVRDKVVV